MPVGGVRRDERPRDRPDRRPAGPAAAGVPPGGRGGTVTAGNSCGINDGAAAVAVVDADTHRRLGVPGLRVLATATGGRRPDPARSRAGPGRPAALDRAGLPLDDLDVVEFNEAFAGQVLACCDALRLDPDAGLRRGRGAGARAPLGRVGRGARRPALLQLVRAGRGRYGLAAIAVGGGQGVAMVVERCR